MGIGGSVGLELGRWDVDGNGSELDSVKNRVTGRCGPVANSLTILGCAVDVYGNSRWG
jgi:hypothetical protein